MKRLSILTAAALLAACTSARPTVPSDNAATGDVRTTATHHARVEIRDVTDPEHPQLVYAKEGNALGACGVRALLGSAFGYTTMGNWNGTNDSLGYLCQGSTAVGEQKHPGTQTNWQGGWIAIGAASASTCTAVGTPWRCCTGNGTGCTPSNYDVVTFAEGQVNNYPDQHMETYWLAWLNTLQSQLLCWNPPCSGESNFSSQLFDANPILSWNGSNLEGIQVGATFGGTWGNQQWCEYAIRSTPAYTGRGPLGVSFNGGTARPGWQLAHGVINPCITKSSGQTFIITWTLSVS